MTKRKREKRTRARELRRFAPGTEPTNTTATSGQTGLLWTTLVFFLHALGLALIFNPFAGSVNPQPLIDQDWGLHYHHLASLEAFWRQDRMIWGYNPFFMAGYPSNTIHDLSIKLFELIAIASSSIALTPVQWFKAAAFLATASVPWMLHFMARNFFAADDAKNAIAAAAASLGTIYWWNSLPREMFFYGMIGFPAAAYASILGISLFYRLTLQALPFRSIHVGWLFFAVAILPLHVQSTIIFLPPMIVLLWIRRRFLTGATVAWTVSGAAVALLLNLLWLLPAIDHRADDVSSAIVRQLPLFSSANPFTFLFDYLGPAGFWTFRPGVLEKGFRLSLLLMGVAGVTHLLRNKERTLAAVLISALSVLFAITYFGALLPRLAAWQPLRFKVPFDIVLAIAAGYYTARWLSDKQAAVSWLAPWVLACGLLAFLINAVQTESSGRLRLRSGLNDDLQRIVEWIQRETPADGRVLFEESGDESGFVYDGVYLSSFVPHLTGRQLIGGPINLYNDRHHFAEFHSGRLFKRDVRTLSDAQLRDYLRLYNIGAVVAFHPESVQRLQALTGLVTVEQRIGPVHLMKVHQPLTWFVVGAGKVSAGSNRLELSELSGSEVVLKYHWVDGLSATPPTTIEAIQMLDDPIPFIKLVAPPSSLTLRVGASSQPPRLSPE